MKSLTEAYGIEFSERIVESWKTYLNAVESVKRSAGQGFSDDEKVRLAITLQNTKDELARHRIHESATQTSALGPFVNHVFELVSSVMPSLVANQIVSVQPMSQKVGLIYYLSYKYGSTKGNVTAGMGLSDPYVVNPNGENTTKYSSEEVEGEFIGESGTTSYSGNLQYIPLKPGYVEFTHGDVVISDNGRGVLSGTGLTSGTINYSSGAYTLVFSGNTTSDIEANYSYDLEYAPSTIPEVQVQLDETVVRARARKLKALYAFDASYDLGKQQGINLDDQIVEVCVKELKQEIDAEIMLNLIRQAGTSVTWNSVPADPTINWQEHKLNFIDHLISTGSIISQNTRRVEGNFIVVGKTAKDIISSFGAPRFVAATNGSVNAGPYFMGTLDGRWKVYYNPYYAASEYLVGYKGDLFIDAGYIYAPYLPIFTTDLIMAEDFVGRRGFATSGGQKMTTNKYYVKGNII